jgi:predicted Zn finger-like uncharacterized protein
MIIQCKQCSTKFRFDDELMRSDGVWVRCSICQYEFFQSHPDAVPAARSEKAGTGETGPRKAEQVQPKPVTPARDSVETEPAVRDEVQEFEPPEPKKRRSFSSMKILATLLLFLLVSVGAAFVLLPDLAQQTLGEWSAYLPWIKKQPPPQPPPIAESIRIDAVKQRFAANLFVGNVRVVEGMAVNGSGQPAARLQVTAMMANEANNRLGEKQVFAGNVLTDTELTVLTEEEINQRLANPQGSTAPIDRIMPGGSVPFMIVIAKEPPGVTKVFVNVTGAERLLQ